MSPRDLLATFFTMDIMSRSSKNVIARARGSKKVNLALKDKRILVEARKVDKRKRW
jgi:hypothetical protein